MLKIQLYHHRNKLHFKIYSNKSFFFNFVEIMNMFFPQDCFERVDYYYVFAFLTLVNV